MIILTSAEADKVRGISPNNNRAALEPVPLKDGTFMLGDEVLNDPAHADVKAFLTGLPKAQPSAANIYTKGDAVPVTTTWKQAGTRTEAKAGAQSVSK